MLGDEDALVVEANAQLTMLVVGLRANIQGSMPARRHGHGGQKEMARKDATIMYLDRRTEWSPSRSES
jgi:hypothetical protein